jgi:hypothetical protein
MKKAVLLVQVILMVISAYTQVVVKIGSIEGAEPGTVISVPVSVSGMDSGNNGTPVSAIQLNISYESNFLTYSSTVNFDPLLPESQWFFNGTGLKYSTNWIEPNLLALSIPDNTELFYINYMYTGGITNLNFIVDTCELLDGSYNIIANVQYVNGQITPSQGANTSRWNGNGEWNTSSNWSNGIPGENTSVTIESGQPTIETNAVCKVLEIMSGASLIVSPGSSLTIDSDFTNNGSLHIESDESGTGSMIVGGLITGTGAYTTEQYLDFSGVPYHLVSSPVSASTAGSHGSLILKNYDESSASWQTMNPNDLLESGHGYQISGNTSGLITFNGAIRNNSTTISGIPSTNPNSRLKGLTAIGNPFTSAISWNMGDWQKNHLDQAVYCWNGYKYICWNGSVGSLADGVIPAMQGFLVKGNASGASLTIPAESRLHSSIPFYKNTEAVSNLLTIKLEKSSGDQHYDEAFVNVVPGSSYSYDSQYDAYKLFGEGNAPEIYTTTPEGEELSIHTQPGFESVPVVCRIPEAGTYRITFSNMSSFGEEQQFSFEDKVGNNTINLRQLDNLMFVSDGSLETTRFVLHFYLVGIGEMTESPFRIWNNNHSLFIYPESSVKQLQHLWIYNSSGQLVKEQGIQDVPSSLDISGLPHGVYIVRLQTDSRVFNGKIISK